MTKYTPEYIAKKRAEMQADERHDNEAGWISPQEYYELLDEIERLRERSEELQEVFATFTELLDKEYWKLAIEDSDEL